MKQLDAISLNTNMNANTTFHVLFVNITDKKETVKNNIQESLNVLNVYFPKDVVGIYYVGSKIEKVIPFVPLCNENINLVLSTLSYDADANLNYNIDGVRSYVDENIKLLNKNIIYVNFEDYHY